MINGGITFSDHEDADQAVIFVVIVESDIRSPESLFDCLTEELGFPEYFDRNWNALVDMLRDLSWISQKHIAIIHRDLPALQRGELKTYLEVLREGCLSCARDKRHTLSVTFPESTRAEVMKLLE